MDIIYENCNNWKNLLIIGMGTRSIPYYSCWGSCRPHWRWRLQLQLSPSALAVAAVVGSCCSWACSIVILVGVWNTLVCLTLLFGWKPKKCEWGGCRTIPVTVAWKREQREGGGISPPRGLERIDKQGVFSVHGWSDKRRGPAREYA